MKIGAEDKRKQTAAIVLFVVAAGLIGYNLLSGPSSTPAPPAPPVVLTAGGVKTAAGPAAAKVGTTSSQLDPTLQMGPMLVTENLVYTGTGRNIFSGEMEAAPVVDIPKPVAPPRQVVTIAPVPPRPAAPAGPPPINLKFFGTSTAMNGTRKAFLLNGDDVFIASIGDVVQRRYRIIAIAATSIQVEDIPNTNKQTLPLVGN